MNTHQEIARWMLAVVALYSCGGFVADAIVPSTSRQHLWNPAWPPHAKFHNGQGMLMGIGLGVLALYILFTSQPLTLRSFLLSAMSASLYWWTMALAPFFPGTAWYDPEFKDASRRPFGLSPQQILCYVHCTLTVLTVVLFVT